MDERVKGQSRTFHTSRVDVKSFRHLKINQWNMNQMMFIQVFPSYIRCRAFVLLLLLSFLCRYLQGERLDDDPWNIFLSFPVNVLGQVKELKHNKVKA